MELWGSAAGEHQGPATRPESHLPTACGAGAGTGMQAFQQEPLTEAELNTSRTTSFGPICNRRSQHATSQARMT
jgi:hypothetical protein